MTSSEINVKFFEHEDNPLPEDGSVHVITTGDGFDLRLGLWPVPGFKISVVETFGASEPGEETSSATGNGTTPGTSENSDSEPTAEPPVSDTESGAEPAGGENPSSETVSAPAADQRTDDNSAAGEDVGTAISKEPLPGGESSNDTGRTIPPPAPDEADPGDAAASDGKQTAHDAGTSVDPNAEDAKPKEALQDQPDGEADAGVPLKTDSALGTAGSGASEADTTPDPSQSADDVEVGDAAGRPEEGDSVPQPDIRLDPDDKMNLAASSPEPAIAEDFNEQVVEKDAALTDPSRDRSPVVDAKSESVAVEGENAATDAPLTDDQAAPAETRSSPTGESGEPSSAETRQPALPLEQAITMSGTIIVLNGRSEFIEKYAEVIHELIDRGFCVAALDWRGQGGSERLIKRRPLKGHIDDMDSYVEDLTTLLDFLETTNCPKPYYCLAHSTGGQILLRAAPLISSRISRAVTTAPFLDLASYRTPKPLVYAFASTLTYAGLGEIYAPGAGRNPPSDDPFEGNAYSSDPRRYQRTADLVHTHKELAIGGPTVSWMYAALKSAGELFDPDFLSSITLPVMMLSASDDKVVSVQAVEDFASMARTVSHLSIPGARHEILMERDEIRSQFWAAFDAFIPGED